MKFPTYNDKVVLNIPEHKLDGLEMIKLKIHEENISQELVTF